MLSFFVLFQYTKVNIDYIVSSFWQLTRYLFLEKVITETWTQPVQYQHNDYYGQLQRQHAIQHKLVTWTFL